MDKSFRRNVYYNFRHPYEVLSFFFKKSVVPYGAERCLTPEKFNSLKTLNQERNEKISVSIILSIKESVGYLVGYLRMSHFMNPLTDGKGDECQYA